MKEYCFCYKELSVAPISPLAHPGSLYPLVLALIFSFLWEVTLTHQSGFVKKDRFFFLISAGSYYLFLSLLNLSQTNHFFSYLLSKDSITIQSPLLGKLLLSQVNYSVFPTLSKLHVLCTCFLTAHHLSKSWGCVMSSCPKSTHPWGRSTHYQGQGHNWITKRSTIVNGNSVWRSILLQTWNIIFLSIHKAAYLIHVLWS